MFSHSIAPIVLEVREEGTTRRPRANSADVRQMSELNLLIPSHHITLLDRVGQGNPYSSLLLSIPSASIFPHAIFKHPHLMIF